jgi:alpha-1,3-rhamnosyltransferase
MSAEVLVQSQTSPSSSGPDSSPPLVTAILVCWNHERFVRQAVQSALKQTYSNLEVIVFDNGSTDASRAELTAMQQEHGFKLIYQDNVGLVEALNRGLAMARGKYLAPLATDDVWLEDKVERQVRYLEANPDVHMLAGGLQFIDASGRVMERELKVRAGDQTFSDLMRNGCSVYGPTVMSRVETLRRLNGFDSRSRIEDYTTALHFARAGYRVVVLDEVLTQYRRHESNWTSKPIWAERLELGQIFRSTPEYRQFVRHSLRGYFRDLAGSNKIAACRLLMNEPIAWTWDDVGIGMLKLATPKRLLVAGRKAFGLHHAN